MDRKQAISQIRALRKVGLTEKTGLVGDGDEYRYGLVTNTDFKTADDRMYNLSEIDTFGFSSHTHTLTLTLNDGDTVRVIGIPKDMVVEGMLEIKSMPSSIYELNHIFLELYPDSPNQLFYDELNERVMVDMTMFGRPEEGIIPFSDAINSIYYENLEQKLKQHGYVGKLPSYTVMDNVLNIQTHNNKRNLFREWVESHEWDGVPRVRNWFRDLFGATAPALEDINMDQKYLGDVSEAWFIGGIKRMYSETKHEIVPVLIGNQGIGKGLALRYTAGQDIWYTDTSIDIKQPQEFLDSARGCIVVELSEAKQIRSADVDLLKAFISKSSDHMRKAYARHSERYPRHFILVASSNIDSIFTDLTGNRRFYPMYCHPENAITEFSQDRAIGQYEVEQVWAEALDLYHNKHKWYLSQEMQNVAMIAQEYATIENSNVDKIDYWLDNNAEYNFVGAKVSKTIILEGVFGIGEFDPIPREVTHAYNAWTVGTKCWERIPKTTRIGGKPTRGFKRTLATGERKAVKRLRIVDGDGIKREKSPADIMRERGELYGFSDTGDDFPTEGLTKSQIDIFLAEGMIWEDSPGKYRVGYMP